MITHRSRPDLISSGPLSSPSSAEPQGVAQTTLTLQRRASLAAAIGGSAFVLVAEDGAAPAQPVGRMEIALGPAVVRVEADVDAGALRRVLEVVRGLA
jgi:hypothetical protein